jgi:hypothetical protein
MLLKNIKNITIAEAIEEKKKGLYFKIQDGKIV